MEMDIESAGEDLDSSCICNGFLFFWISGATSTPIFSPPSPYLSFLSHPIIPKYLKPPLPFLIPLLIDFSL